MAGKGACFTLSLWHPNCWAIEPTSKYDDDILAYIIHDTPITSAERSSGLSTTHGEPFGEVETLLDAIANSELTDEVLEL